MTTDSLFAPVYSRQTFLETLGGGEALRRLDDGLGAREPFLLVTGGPGIGKTALACEAVARWGSRVTPAFLAYPALTGAEFLEEIIRRFGAEPPEGASRSKLVACLDQALAENTSRGQVAMLVVDDAHHLSAELLEELRLLVNAAQQVRRPLEVLLVGLPALEARLDEPALVALRQRVSVHAKLEPLSAAETRRYLHHRITAGGGDGPSLFSRKTCRDIAARTGGVPRQINSLAAEALRVARAWGDQTVGSEHVQTAAAALGGFVPTGVIEDSADSGSEDSPAPIAPPRSLATARAPVVAPPPAHPPQPSPSAEAVLGAPSPAHPPQASPSSEAIPRALAQSAAPAETSPASKRAGTARIEASATPTPTAPANHDPREWVARFVGDRGPLQLSSRVLAESTWSAEPSEANDAESPSPTETSPTPRGLTDRTRPRSRSKHGGDLRVAATALFAAIVVITAVALVMRAVGLARSRAGQFAGATATATAPQDANKASSSGVLRAGSRTAGASPVARVGEHGLEGSTTRSRRPYTLDVCGTADLESALDQRDRMQELTGIEGWVVAAAGGGDEPYRIVLGAYRSHERATAAANMLLNSRTLSDVKVVPLPPRSARR